MKRTMSENSSIDRQCSICGLIFPVAEFAYGRRDNRSYCRKCDREEKAAYRRGGVDATSEYRESKRAAWKIDTQK